MQQACTALVEPTRGTETSGGAAPQASPAFERALRDAQDRLGCLHEIAALVCAQARSEAPDRIRRLAAIHASLTHVADAVALAHQVAQYEAPSRALASATAVQTITGQLDLVAVALECLDQYGGRSPRDEAIMAAVLERLTNAHARLGTLLEEVRA